VGVIGIIKKTYWNGLGGKQHMGYEMLNSVVGWELKFKLLITLSVYVSLFVAGETFYDSVQQSKNII